MLVLILWTQIAQPASVLLLKLHIIVMTPPRLDIENLSQPLKWKEREEEKNQLDRGRGRREAEKD